MIWELWVLSNAILSTDHGHYVPVGALASPSSAYDFTVVQYGKERTLKEFEGQVTVVLNIASE